MNRAERQEASESNEAYNKIKHEQLACKNGWMGGKK